MLSKNELRYLLALQHTPNLGDASAKKLLHHIGSAEGIFKEKKENLLKIDGIGKFKLKEFNLPSHLDAADEELQFIETHQINYQFFKDPGYPEHLKHCLDGPILIFTKGNYHVENRRLISIVGTRNMTVQGKRDCEKFIADLAPLNPVIVSGFAYGVDITAHKAAIANKLQTIACLAHGLDKVYPKIHQRFISEVQQYGCLLTEFWSTDTFERTNFLKRNRIIAGISEATIVIESGEKGGSLVTADIANSYNREVFAMPGRVTDRQSKGCNYLIKTQQAHLLTNAADLIYMLGWNPDESKTFTRQTSLFAELNGEESKIIDFLKHKEKEIIDEIAIECRIPVFKVARILLDLELKGLVQPLPGKVFKLI